MFFSWANVLLFLSRYQYKQHFVSFVLINKINLYFSKGFLFSIKTQTIFDVFVSFLYRIGSKLKLYLLYFGFTWTQKNEHFVSFCFINKYKNVLRKRFYSSSDQKLDSFERFRFVSISKLYYRSTFMIVDIPTKQR